MKFTKALNTRKHFEMIEDVGLLTHKVSKIPLMSYGYSGKKMGNFDVRKKKLNQNLDFTFTRHALKCRQNQQSNGSFQFALPPPRHQNFERKL